LENVCRDKKEFTSDACDAWVKWEKILTANSIQYKYTKEWNGNLRRESRVF
jgi:hypothetical protein